MTIWHIRIACWIPKATNTHSYYVEHVWNVVAHAQKPDLVFQRNRRAHLNRRGASVQSTAGSRGVGTSGSNGSNAGYTMFWSRVQDYWLPTPLACFPFTPPTVRHRVPSGFNWALPHCFTTTTTKVTRTRLSVTLYLHCLPFYTLCTQPHISI